MRTVSAHTVADKTHTHIGVTIDFIETAGCRPEFMSAEVLLGIDCLGSSVWAVPFLCQYLNGVRCVLQQIVVFWLLAGNNIVDLLANADHRIAEAVQLGKTF